MATPSRADYLASVTTAQEDALAQGAAEQQVDIDARARADAANVSGVQFIDYAEAIDNYAARSDVEPLSQRRAREAAATPADQNFARHEDYDGGFSAAPGDDNPYT